MWNCHTTIYAGCTGVDVAPEIYQVINSGSSIWNHIYTSVDEIVLPKTLLKAAFYKTVQGGNPQNWEDIIKNAKGKISFDDIQFENARIAFNSLAIIKELKKFQDIISRTPVVYGFMTMKAYGVKTSGNHLDLTNQIEEVETTPRKVSRVLTGYEFAYMIRI